MTNTYDDFAKKTRSSKLVLCHIESKQRLSVFSLSSGTIYEKNVDYFVVDVKEDNTSLTEASNASLSTGEWYYNPITGVLYVNTTDDSDPKTKTIVVTYRHFFSNRSVDLPYDLESGVEVNYDGRLKSNSPINKELDDEQTGIVLETSTNLSFYNNDGFFDDIYDVLIFENAGAKIWSWSEILPLSEKKKIFDGTIQNKRYAGDVSFSCKDFTYNLRKPLNAVNFSSSDGQVPERYLNTPKRRLFGQFTQLQCIPISATLEGFELTGTLNITAGSTTISGTSTDFLDELSPEDELIYEADNETIKFSVKSVNSDVSATLSSEPEITLVNATVKVKPKIGYRKRNRRWHIAGHKLRAPSTTVTDANSSSRFTVDDIDDFFSGDLIKVDGESVFIKRVSFSDISLETVLQSGKPSVSDTVVKSPVSKVFLDGSEVFIDRDWTIENNTNDAVLVLDDLAEFNVAPIVDIPVNLTFTNSSREVTTSLVDLRNEVKPRDWIRSDDITHTTWYEILEVNENSLKLRTAYAGSTDTTNAQKKNVNILNDDSIVTVNCLGQERSGNWVKTASDAVKDILQNDAGLSNINTASFTEADSDAPFILSYASPRRIGGSNQTIKQVISDINTSVFGSLVTDNDFNLKYQVLNPEVPSDIEELKDDDLSSPRVPIESRNEIVRKVNAKFAFFSDKFTGDESFQLYEFTNDFVDYLVGADAEMDLDIFLFSLDDATTIAQRYALYNSLSTSKLTVSGKLNLWGKILNDKILLNLDRLYKRFGNRDKRKIGIINKVTNDGKNITLEINDLGNAFNRVSLISSNTAADFTSAENSEKINNSYIVDNDTETPDTTSDNELYNNIIG